MSVADKKGVGIDLSKCPQPPPSGRLQPLFASGDRLKHSLLIVDNFIHCQPLRFLILYSICRCSSPAHRRFGFLLP